MNKSAFLTEVNINNERNSNENTNVRKLSRNNSQKYFLSNLEAQYQNDPEKGFTMDLMMSLDTKKIRLLRNEFEKKESGLSLTEFVMVMLNVINNEIKSNSSDTLNNNNSENDEEIKYNLNNNLNNTNKFTGSLLYRMTKEQLVANLCELFAQIDVNGDENLEWEEFTSFIVDAGLSSQDHQPDAIQLYHPSKWEDQSKHITFIEKIYYFSSNDRIAICENGSHLLKIYNSDCDLLKSIKHSEGVVLCADYINKYNQYVMATSDLQLSFYDELTYRLIKTCHVPISQTCMNWYQNSNILFTAGVNGIVYAWDADKMEEKHHMGGIEKDNKTKNKSHQDIVLDLLGLPTLESVASASMDKTIHLWDVNTGKHKQQLDGHTKGVRSLSYSQEYRFLISAGFDYDAIVWNPYVDHFILRLHGHTNSLCGVEIVAETPQIITCDIQGIFKIWDIRNFSCMQTFTSENINDIRTFKCAYSHKRIIAGGRKLVKFEYEKLKNPESTDDHAVIGALYNPTSMTFITVSGKDVKIWDANHGRLIRIYRGLSSTDLTSLCLDFRNRKFIVGDHEGNIKVYDYLNGVMIKSFNYLETQQRAHLKEVSKLFYCNEHRVILSSSWDLTICIHDERDSEKGILLRQLKNGHANDITALTYSFNLSLIATGSSDSTIQLWDFEFGRLEGTCIGHTSGILSLVFIDPWPLLVSSDTNGNLCFWSVRYNNNNNNNNNNNHLNHTTNRCVFYIKNKLRRIQSGGIYLAPFTCLTTFINYINNDKKDKINNQKIENYYLFAGDERGYLINYDILPLLNELENNYKIKQLIKPIECLNPYRILRIDAQEIIKKSNSTSYEKLLFDKRDLNCNFYFLPGSPYIQGNNLLYKSILFHAHKDVIYSIQVIKEPLTLLTASFDRLVKLWTFHGECLGTLTQGGMQLSKRNWSFKTDITIRDKKRMDIAHSVLQNISENTKETCIFNQKEKQFKSYEKNTETEIDTLINDESFLRNINFDSIHISTNSSLLDNSSVRKTPRLQPVTPQTAGKSFRRSKQRKE